MRAVRTGPTTGRPRGGVVTQRSAKPFTPVQFRTWPPISRASVRSDPDPTAGPFFDVQVNDGRLPGRREFDRKHGPAVGLRLLDFDTPTTRSRQRVTLHRT